MLERSPEKQAALASGHIEPVWLVWCEATHPETGLPDPAGFWNGAGDVEVSGRLYHAAAVIDVGPVSAVGDLTVPELRITLSGLPPDAIALVNNATVGRAPLTYHLGLFDDRTQMLIGEPWLMFDGFVNDVNRPRPPAGGDSVITLICTSSSRELYFEATGTRSDAIQHQRDPADSIYRYTAVQRAKPLYFGRRET